MTELRLKALMEIEHEPEAATYRWLVGLNECRSSMRPTQPAPGPDSPVTAKAAPEAI
jgi:hypothetical protein